MSTSESPSPTSKSPSQLVELALALSRHGTLPASKLIATELSSAIAEVVRNRQWRQFDAALLQVKRDPVASEALLASAHLVASRVNLSNPDTDLELTVELVALPVVLEPGSQTQVLSLPQSEAMQETLSRILPEAAGVILCDELLTEAQAFGSPRTAQQLMERLLDDGGMQDPRRDRHSREAQPKTTGELRFLPGIVIHQTGANPWRGRLTAGLREQFAYAANAWLRKLGRPARLRFGELSRWPDARREGHALYQAVKLETHLSRVCQRLGADLSHLRAQIRGEITPCSVTASFYRAGQAAPFLEKRFLSWSEAYCADLVRELAYMTFTHRMPMKADEFTAPLLEACMALSAVPQTVRALVAEGRSLPAPESGVLQ